MWTGACLCGALRYQLVTPFLGQVTCHCRNCQRQGGSAFSVLVLVEAEHFVLAGRAALYVDHSDSGNEVHRHFCGGCGSPVYTVLPSRPGLVYVKGGTLDRARELAPKLNVWCESAWDSTLFSPDPEKRGKSR